MKTTKNRKNLLIHIVLIAGIAVTVFPFLWMIFTSFKTLPESMQIPPTILPEKIIWDSYKYVFEVLPFAQIYVNTIIITVLTVLFQVAFCTMAAYGFARIEFPFKNAIFIVLLAILMADSDDGSGADFPDSTVFDYSEPGTGKYVAGSVPAKLIQCVWYIPAETVLYVFTKRT